MEDQTATPGTPPPTLSNTTIASAAASTNATKRHDEGGEAETSVRRRRVVSTARLTLSAASRLLRRKIPQSGHLMLPKRMWMQTVPTQDCEVVVVLAAGTREATLHWLLTRLKTRLPEVTVCVKNHAATNSYALYLSASYDGLIKGGEEMCLVKRTKPEYGGGLRELSHAELGMFQGVEDGATFFSTLERQSIVLYLLHSLRAGQGEDVQDTVFREGEPIIPKFQSVGLIHAILPLHDYKRLEHLRATWVQTFFRYQPIEAIQQYFGSKIAIYFAWLGHYTTALTVPAVIGLIFWVCLWGRDQALEDKGFVLFALLNVVWASMWLEGWKRHSAVLAYNWGTLDTSQFELLAEARPHFTRFSSWRAGSCRDVRGRSVYDTFKSELQDTRNTCPMITHTAKQTSPSQERLRASCLGELRVSGVTGRMEPDYPAWRRNLTRYLVTVPVVLCCLLVVFFVMLLILQLQDLCDAFITEHEYTFYLSYAPKVLMALSISAFDEGYTKLAVWLNDLENYRVEETYQNHLIIKLAVFRFVNSFLSLFYIAFYLQDMERLKEQLAALLLTRQVVGNIKESCIPYLLEQFKLAKLSFDLYGALSPSEENKQQEWPQEKPPPQPAANDTQLLEEEEEEEQERTGDSTEAGTGEDGPAEKAEKARKVRDGGDPCLARGSSKNRIVSQAEVECNMSRYDGTFEDYLEMFIQFGYVTLFSSAFPLAATCAFLNNLIEIRSDAFKLCCVFQRPFGNRAQSIGVWQDAMELMGVLGIIVNCILIGLSGQVHRMFPHMSTAQTIVLIVVLEHIMIALKYGISYAIPDIPEWVATEMAKVEFQRREALRRLSTSNSPPTREDSQPPSPSKYLFGHSLSSTEYVDRSVQTDVIYYRRRSFKTSPTSTIDEDEVLSPSDSDSKRESLSESGEHDELKDDDPTRASVRLGRSVSACERARQRVPRVNRIRNQESYESNDSEEDAVPKAFDSLPMLSAPATVDKKNRLFRFSPENESALGQMKPRSRLLERPEFAQFSSRSAECVADPSLHSRYTDDSTGHISEEGTPEDSLASRTPTPSSEDQTKLATSTPPTPQAEAASLPTPTTMERKELPAPRKKPQMKFLKRAQSLSYVFKRNTKPPDKRKKIIADDFAALMAPGEAQGEMSLVPLEKLVAIDDIQMQPSLSSYNVYTE